MLTDLAVTPISETLRKLSVDRRSGDLQVQSGRIVKTVFFDHGRIVFAASNLKKDRLGEALVALGRITDEEFTRVSALLKEEGRKRRFGDALVQSGVLDKNEVGRSVSRQVDRIVLSLFEFGEGVAAFEDRASAIPLEYMVSLSIHRVLYDGIHLMKNQDLVLAGLGDLDRRVTLAAVTPFAFDMKDSPAEERDILEQSRRKVTLRRLGWQPGGLSFPRLRACYALMAASILVDEDAQTEAAAQPVVNMETGTFLLSTLRHQPDPSARDAIRKELSDELERSAHLDREGWLKVSRNAPREELIKALEDKMERYHGLLDAAGDDEQLRTDLELILGRASAMLRLARQAPAPVMPPAAVPAVSGWAPGGGGARRGCAPGRRVHGRHGPGGSPASRGRGTHDRLRLRQRGQGVREAGGHRSQRGAIPRAAGHRDGRLSAHRQAGRARVPRRAAPRAEQRRHPLPVRALLQGDEAAGAGAGGNADGGEAQPPAPHGPRGAGDPVPQGQRPREFQEAV